MTEPMSLCPFCCSVTHSCEAIEDDDSPCPWGNATSNKSSPPMSDSTHTDDSRSALEVLARAYDREDSAQRGEPDPWTELGIDLSDTDWEAERLACAAAGFAALTASGLSIVPAVTGDVGELVAKLRDGDDLSSRIEAASTIERQAAEIERLWKEWELQRELKEHARAECDRAEAENARLVARVSELEKGHRLRLHGLSLAVARELVEQFGGEETDMTVEFIKDGHSGTGFYSWCTDYPEEGSTFLGDASEHSLLFFLRTGDHADGQ